MEIESKFLLLQSQFNDLFKKVARLEKKLKKITMKGVKTVKKPRTPSGFSSPIKISNELCEFLGIAAETHVARTEVTKMIIQYIKDNDLQNVNNRKNIDLDEKLIKLLQPKPDEIVTFFSIQKLLKHHYPKI